MPYEVLWMPKAQEALKGIDKEVMLRIVRKLEEVKELPHHFTKRLSNSPAVTVRIGDYRAYVRIRDAEKVVEILYVAHRKKAYKPGS